jgi:hypothetical protein
LVINPNGEIRIYPANYGSVNQEVSEKNENHPIYIDWSLGKLQYTDIYGHSFSVSEQGATNVVKCDEPLKQPPFSFGKRLMKQHFKFYPEELFVGNSPILFCISPDGSGMRRCRDIEVLDMFKSMDTDYKTEEEPGIAPKSIMVSQSRDLIINEGKDQIILYEIVL